MDNNREDLKHIRSMMERSSKFLSLSGISGIVAGACALLGAGLAYYMIQGELEFGFFDNLRDNLFLLAVLVLICASGSGLYFSLRKAKQSNSKFWLPVTKQILKDFAVPMIAGGIFCIIQIYHHMAYFMAPTMLIFYGLALIAAGSKTYRDIKILGACEIVLGLLSAIFISHGLLFWTLGFGVLHIVYGTSMYFKYDRETAKDSKS